MFTLKYFSYTDPITGGLTKAYGQEYSYQTQRIGVKFLEGKPVVIKNSIEDIEHSVTPTGEDLKEITKDEFDNLDVKDESILSRLARERMFLQNIKKEKWVTASTSFLSNEQILEKATEAAKVLPK